MNCTCTAYLGERPEIVDGNRRDNETESPTCCLSTCCLSPQADTIEELADKFGIDAAGLAEAVERYNSYCEGGEDEEFAKTAEQLVPSKEGTPIDGLYAIGTDGVRLYRKVYPIQIGATCCGNNVNSGRTAIRHIVENVL